MMVTKTVEKEVIYSKDGTPYSVTIVPGSLRGYHEWVKKIQAELGHLLTHESVDDFIKARREEAEKEWDE